MIFFFFFFTNGSKEWARRKSHGKENLGFDQNLSQEQGKSKPQLSSGEEENLQDPNIIKLRSQRSRANLPNHELSKIKSLSKQTPKIHQKWKAARDNRGKI